jgi:hypothetical protein
MAVAPEEERFEEICADAADVVVAAAAVAAIGSTKVKAVLLLLVC